MRPSKWLTRQPQHFSSIALRGVSLGDLQFDMSFLPHGTVRQEGPSCPNFNNVNAASACCLTAGTYIIHGLARSGVNPAISIQRLETDHAVTVRRPSIL